jgi:hypothetical protein
MHLLMSNLVFVNDALSLIGVLAQSQNASAEDGALALRAANEMVDEWADDGVTVNWSPQSSLDDECPLVGNELTAVKHHLAIRLCPHFGREPSPTLLALALAAYGKLQRKQMVQGMAPVEIPLPRAEGDWYSYDVTTDNF